MPRTVVYENGPVAFRQKIVLSALTNQPIRIKNIRNRKQNPGVTAAEVDFLKLINEISNGAIVRVNDTGCHVFFSPGTLIGGEIDFKCSAERALGYYLEPLIILCSFTKSPMQLTLTGVTNNSIDPSVDVIIQSWLPFLKKFLPPASAAALKLEIKKRGLAPKGGGKVVFTSKPAHHLSPIRIIAPGKVYRIRGVAWTCLVSPNVASQLMHGAKELLNKFLSDVYINLDIRKKEAAGSSPGFGLVLWAETKEGVFYTADVCNAAEAGAEPGGTAPTPVVPSELGVKAASLLLDQIFLGGCVDESLLGLALSLMACEGGHNASQLLVPAPTPHAVHSLRLLRSVLGVTFDLSYVDRLKMFNGGSKEDDGANEKTSSGEGEDEEELDDDRPVPLVATCFGSGIKNINLAIR